MTRSFRKEKRKSMVSMSHYDFQDASYSGYHKKYLKLVAATIFFTIIGIIIFIQLQKDIKAVNDSGHSGHSGHYRFSMASEESVYQPALSRNPNNTAVPATHPFSRRFQKRQWTTVGYVKTSKENEFRQHLEQMQNLISDLKYNF